MYGFSRLNCIPDQLKTYNAEIFYSIGYTASLNCLFLAIYYILKLKCTLGIGKELMTVTTISLDSCGHVAGGAYSLTLCTSMVNIMQCCQ